MKATALPIFLIFGLYSYSQSQNGLKSLDPRQFIDVKYSKAKSDSAISIANWNKDSELFQQRVSRIDMEGSLEISFLIEELVANTNFYGAISLEAELYGRDGSRKIEVNPYSLIGQNQTEYGINSISPSELANRLILTRTAVMDARVILNKLRILLQNQSTDTNIVEIESRITGYPFKSETLKSELTALSSRIFMAPESIDKEYLTSLKPKLKKLLQEEFNNNDSFKKDIGSFFESDAINQQTNSDEAFHILRFVDNIIYRTVIEDLNNEKKSSIVEQILGATQQLELIREYLQSIRDAGADTETTFLSLAQCDRITFLDLLSKMDRCLELSTTETSNQKKWYTLYNNVLSTYETLIDKIQTHTNLAHDISSLIYSKLINAKIDLKKENAQPGETLNISILWNDRPNKTTKISLCRFSIEQTGLQFKIMDAFYLVERINQGKGDSLQSPSNFKGAGGVSMMLSYYKNDLNSNAIRKDLFGKKCNLFWNVMNALQPSIGLNVSYLDFDIKKDFEIGTGLCLGFFRSQLLFTYGINFHKTQENWYNASYFGVGFSFINIADNIRNK